MSIFPKFTSRSLVGLRFSSAIACITSAILTADPGHALIFDTARAQFTSDLTAAGFDNAGAVGLLFGLLEFVLVAIPVAAALMSLARMNQGAEAWMPWVQTLGGSLVVLAFVAVVVTQVYG